MGVQRAGVAFAGLVLLVAAACGGEASRPSASAPTAGGTAPAETAAPAPPPTEPPPTTAAPAAPPTTGGAVRSGTRSGGETAAPVVRQPPPRPNRAERSTPESPPAAASPESTAVHPDDFPDPFVLRAGSYWYAYATQGGLTQVPVMRSADLRTWEKRGDALRRLPAWAEWGHTWAPAVMARPAGFVLYYTARHAATGLQCITHAVSVLPEGPFVDTSEQPFICQTDRGGSIDPSPFVAADGRPWLTWKSEGTVDGEPTRIWSAPLADDGRSLVGEPAELLARAAVPWEGPIVEAPVMMVRDGRHHLFYSGNRWETADYAVGHAVCRGPAGPCERSVTTPVLATSGNIAGPGGAEVFSDVDGSLLVAFHAWDPANVGYPQGARRLHISSLRFDGDRPSITPRSTPGPSTTPTSTPLG